jgi:hypothetical protein
MTTSQVLPSRLPESHPLQLAVAGYLARFKGISRTHAESDLRAYLRWCTDHQLDPLAASRPHIELYVRWMQEIRRLSPHPPMIVGSERVVTPRCPCAAGESELSRN